MSDTFQKISNHSSHALFPSSQTVVRNTGSKYQELSFHLNKCVSVTACRINKSTHGQIASQVDWLLTLDVSYKRLFFKWDPAQCSLNIKRFTSIKPPGEQWEQNIITSLFLLNILRSSSAKNTCKKRIRQKSTWQRCRHWLTFRNRAPYKFKSII